MLLKVNFLFNCKSSILAFICLDPTSIFCDSILLVRIFRYTGVFRQTDSEYGICKARPVSGTTTCKDFFAFAFLCFNKTAFDFHV